jgi:RNA polymerase sigma-70 factor (ECF subfamily)
MEQNSSGSDGLLARARVGDVAAVNEIFTRHRDRLRRMVELRLDQRLRARVDPSDVLQEAYLEITGRLADYLQDPKLSLFLWLRLVVGERLVRLHRQHLGVQGRDARREVSLYRDSMPEASSVNLAAHLAAEQTTPSQAAARAEELQQLCRAIEQVDPNDREVLTLRHFEQLSRAEAAEALGISPAAVAKRYVRALRRLRTLLAEGASGAEGH